MFFNNELLSLLQTQLVEGNMVVFDGAGARAGGGEHGGEALLGLTEPALLEYQ